MTLGRRPGTPPSDSILSGSIELCTRTPAQDRLLAASTKGTGAWLQALPVSALGLCMDDDVMRIAFVSTALMALV